MNLNAAANAFAQTSAVETQWSARLHTAGILASALAIALLGGHLISESASAWLAALASILVGSGLWLSRKAQHANWRARFLRRRALLADSLGYQGALMEALDVITDELSDREAWSATTGSEDQYYGSGSPQGTERLRENLIESAWWTEKLYAAVRSEFIVRATLLLSFALCMAASIVFLESGALDFTAAVQLLSVALVFAISADQLDAVAKWGWASREALRIRLSASSDAGASGDAATLRLWAAFADYAVVTSIAPAVPRRVYERHSAKLESVSAAISTAAKAERDKAHH